MTGFDPPANGHGVARGVSKGVMDYQTIQLERDGNLAVLILNRPEKLNSFTMAMHRELKDALAEVERSGARALVITGAGRGFCAGQDLADPEATLAGNTDLGAGLEEHYNPLILGLRGMGIPVIGAVNGVAAGAGMSLALACDIVLAARSAQFIQAFSRIGLVPDAGSTYFLTRVLGEGRAKALAMLGEALDADTACQWGLVWRVFDDDALMGEARTLGARLADGATVAHGLTKQAIHAASGNVIKVQLDLERGLQRDAGRTSDFAEGVQAFLEKRPARFTGA